MSVFDARNRIIASPDGNHRWDPRGTLDAIVDDHDNITADYDFDNLGRLNTVTPAGETAVTVTYDAFDRIASRNGQTFGYNGAAIDPVTIGDDTYGRSPGGNLLSTNENTPSVAVRDRHGDVVATLNTNGTVASTSAYDPFGEPLHTTGDTPALGFQADYTDPTTGDVWMGARWYDPSNATFRSRDTVFGELQTPISLNRYTYAFANPLAYWDPDGRLSQHIIDAELSDSWRNKNQRFLGINDALPTPKPKKKTAPVNRTERIKEGNRIAALSPDDLDRSGHQTDTISSSGLSVDEEVTAIRADEERPYTEIGVVVGEACPHPSCCVLPNWAEYHVDDFESGYLIVLDPGERTIAGGEREWDWTSTRPLLPFWKHGDFSVWGGGKYRRDVEIRVPGVRVEISPDPVTGELQFGDTWDVVAK